MDTKNGIAAAIDEQRTGEKFKTTKATYESFPPICKLIADACIKTGNLVITEG